MEKSSKFTVLVLASLLLGNLLVSGAKAGIAQGMGMTIASATTEEGKPACWLAVGDKVYFVEKDETTILKVKASGVF